MPRFRSDFVPRLSPARRQQTGYWHCERCRTGARGRYCPRCQTCGELMAAGEFVTAAMVAEMRRAGSR